MFIQVPDIALRDRSLSASSVLILGMIISLNRSQLGCLAHNRYFSDILGLTTRTISRNIADLENKKYIAMNYIERTDSTKGKIRIVVPTKSVLLNLETATKNVIKAQNKWNKQKNILPNDIHSDWLDDYINNLE